MLGPKPKLLPFHSPEQLAAAIRRGARWRAGLIEFVGSMQRKSSTTYTSISGSSFSQGYDGFASGSFSGSAVSTTVEPDYVAQMRAYQLADRLMSNAISEAEYIRSVTLKANTVMPGRYVAGAVYFQRDKKWKDALLSIAVGDEVFEFPFRFERRR
jgi:hypothetical protein